MPLRSLIGHENEVAPGETQVGRDARALRADRPLGHLHDHVGADRINVRNILGGDPFLWPPLLRPIDLFDAAVERGRDRVPEMEEGIFLEADVDEHRLQPHLDVLDSSLVDAADNVTRGVALDVIFFEPAVLEQRHAALQFLDADNQLVAGLAGKSQKFSNFSIINKLFNCG